MVTRFAWCLGRCIFLFSARAKSGQLETVVISPYSGDWHSGVDIYKRWKATWFKAPVSPAWVQDINSWQQIQINSTEDDLRTRYSDLPRRAEQAAKNGVSAIQLVGWKKAARIEAIRHSISIRGWALMKT